MQLQYNDNRCSATKLQQWLLLGVAADQRRRFWLVPANVLSKHMSMPISLVERFVSLPDGAHSMSTDNHYAAASTANMQWHL